MFSRIIQKYWPEFYRGDNIPDICETVDEQLTKTKPVPGIEVFTRPFQLLDADNVRCVFLGETLIINKQRGNYITNGILFSSGKSFGKHQSTKNLHNELLRSHPDVNVGSDGDLSEWCRRGILMIPIRFTFDPENQKRYQYWNMFTSALLQYLYEKNNDILVVLFGSASREFLKSGSMSRCYFELIQVPHPSTSNFIGCQLFQDIDDYYKGKGWELMDWNL